MLSYFSVSEYRFLREQFGGRKHSPIKGVVVMSLIFALSFLFRSAVNIAIAIDPQGISQMQCRAVVDGKAGWAILVFSLQFFGETLPLAILFWIQ
jgi:hypothetical protein